MPTPAEMLMSLNGQSMSGGGDMIRKYLQDGGVGLNPSQLAWCAAAVNSSLAQSGYTGTGSNLARSFMKWGQGTDTPKPGDITVMTRGNPNGVYGHVGFFQGYDDDGNVKVLGGNQSNGVNVATFPKDRVLGFRSVGDPATPPANQTAASVPGLFGRIFGTKYDTPASPIPFQTPQGSAAMPQNIAMSTAPGLSPVAGGAPSFAAPMNQQVVADTAKATPFGSDSKDFNFAGLGSAGMAMMAQGAPHQTWQPGPAAQAHKAGSVDFSGLLSPSAPISPQDELKKRMMQMGLLG